MPIFDVRCVNGHEAEFIGQSTQVPAHRCDICGETVERLFTVGRSSVVTDSIPGGMIIENMSPQPMTFYSHSAWRAKMKELGLVNKVRHVPGDKHVQAWGGTDPQTLENGRLLAERQ